MLFPNRYHYDLRLHIRRSQSQVPRFLSLLSLAETITTSTRLYTSVISVITCLSSLKKSLKIPKVIIRKCNSKTDRQYNGRTKRTNDDLQNTLSYRMSNANPSKNQGLTHVFRKGKMTETTNNWTFARSW